MSNRILVLSASVAVLASAFASPARADAPAVPETLAPAATERMAFSSHARGVQIYRCDVAEGQARWAFVAPEAQLFESAATTTPIGTHGAGPYWQGADGSRIVGKVKARVEAPDAHDIPWLLLTTTSQGPAGQMSRVTSVQRLRTAGGTAPATGCTAAADAGKEARVPYVADYVFFATP